MSAGDWALCVALFLAVDVTVMIMSQFVTGHSDTVETSGLSRRTARIGFWVSLVAAAVLVVGVTLVLYWPRQ